MFWIFLKTFRETPISQKWSNLVKCWWKSLWLVLECPLYLMRLQFSRGVSSSPRWRQIDVVPSRATPEWRQSDQRRHEEFLLVRRSSFRAANADTAPEAAAPQQQCFGPRVTPSDGGESSVAVTTREFLQGLVTHFRRDNDWKREGGESGKIMFSTPVTSSCWSTTWLWKIRCYI